MKKGLLFVSLFISTMLAFTGCDKEDEYQPIIPPTDLSTTFGVDANTKLNLNYSETPLSGKQVAFSTTDSRTATMILKDIVPGEAETTINDIQLIEGNSEYTFEGNSTITRASSLAIGYSGTVKKGELTLNLNIQIADPKGWAKTYTLGEYVTEKLVYNGFENENATIASALYMSWKVNENPNEIGTAMPIMFRCIAGAILPQVLQSVTLEADGNVGAKYSTGNAIQFNPSWVFKSPTKEEALGLIPTKGWLQSPKNLAHWFEKDGKLYIKLNISAILSQALSNGESGNNAQLGNMINTILGSSDAAAIKTLLKSFGLDISTISDATINMLLSWVKEGIPMNVKTENGHTYIYLDKTAFDSLMTDNETPQNDSSFGEKSDILKLWLLLTEAGIIPQEYQLAGILFMGMPQNWPATTEFNIGLDLK